MNIKSETHRMCLELLNDKIFSLGQLILDARSASNNDTKSSMGDKYETTREMMQIEIDKLNKQLYDTQQMLLTIKIIEPNVNCTMVESGALIATDKLMFYISTGLGKIQINGQIIMAISLGSPIGKAMLSKKKGDIFYLNGVSYRITDIS